LDRLRRYFKRFQRINDGGEFDRPVEDLLNDIHAFFQNCYHFKDWLKNDPAFAKHSPQQIEQHVTNTPELAICADICNSTKHLTLTSTPRSGSLPALGKKQITVDITDTLSFGSAPAEEVPQKISMKVEIDHNGATLDAFDVARRAIRAWESFV
jgi:hypothetical protein